MMKRLLSLALALLLLLGLTTACGKKKETQAKPEDDTISSLDEAKAAIEDGRYEEAYIYLLDDDSDEAKALREKFCYVPTALSLIADDGTVIASGRWTYDANGYPLTHEVSGGFDPETPPAEGKVVCTYDDKGQMLTKQVTQTSYAGETTSARHTYTYDDAGHRLTEEIAHSDGSVESYRYTYDAAGHLLTEDITYADGLEKACVYTYDVAGNPLTKETTRSDGTWEKEVTTYDEQGNVVTRESTNSEGEIDKRTYSPDRDEWGQICLYSYSKISLSYGESEDGTYSEQEEIRDAAGNLLEKRQYEHSSLSGSYGIWTVYTYDDKGNLLTEKSSYYEDADDWEGSVYEEEDVRTCQYTYDAAGNMLTSTERTFDDGEEWGRDECTYTYDAKGKMLTMTRQSYEEGEWLSTRVNTYDAEGRVETWEEDNADGKWRRGVTDYDFVTFTDSHPRSFVEYTLPNGDYCQCTFDPNGNCILVEECVGGNVTKTTLTYSVDGHCLAETCTGDDVGIVRRVYTYGQRGTMLSEKREYADGSVECEVRNEAGRFLSYECASRSDQMTWELRYYPNGISSYMEQVLHSIGGTYNAFQQNIFNCVW